MLIDAGASASTAVESAPGAAAGACGLRARTGRRALGPDANLLAVDGDPLADIAALRKVRTVVSDGRPDGAVADDGGTSGRGR